MTKRHLLYAMACAFAAVGIGCKNSAKTAQSMPNPSPAPQLPTRTPAQAPAVAATSKLPPDLATMVPVRTFQVTPPASFTAEQLPQGRAVEFLVPGHAGQALLVKLTEADTHYDPYGTAPRARLEVRLLGDVSPALEPGGDNTGNWLYALAQTGTYRVRLDPGGYRHNIQFTLLAANDPIVDPGIRAEQISIDFGSVVREHQLALVPYANFEGYEEDFWPSHLAVENQRFGRDHFEFRIMPITGYRKIFKDRSMDALQALLLTHGKDARVKKLPYSYFEGGGLNLWTQPELLQGDGWRGLRWIGAFGQDDTCDLALDGQDSAYFFEGISNDGRSFILIRASISNPEAGHRLSQQCTALSEAPGRNDDSVFEKAMPAVFDKELSAADPASFTPNLDQLDAVIKSLKLKP